MQPSSLVFVAIVAVWGAVLIPHWLRRRDQLVHEQRGEDGAVGRRVLEPRRPASHAPSPSTGAVHQPRRAAHAAAQSVPSAPKDAEAATSATSSPSTRQASPSAATAREAAPTARRTGPTSPRRGSGLSTVRRRALLLLGLVLATAGCWVAVPLTTLLWWGALPVTGLLVLDVMAVVVAAKHRARRRAVMARIRAQERQRAQHEAAAAEQVARLARQAAAARQEAAARADGTWVPVPVPPPTYTLKASAPRPEPAPLGGPAATSVPPATAVAGTEPAWDDLVARRAVNA